MRVSKLAAIVAGMALGAVAGIMFALSNVSAASSSVPAPDRGAPTPRPSIAPAAASICLGFPLAIAFTSNVSDSTTLHLPWGKAGDAEGEMIEDYGPFDGARVREQLPVHDVTTGSLLEMVGHNAVDIALPSGTPLYAVTAGTAYRITNWTIPGGPQGWAVVVVSDGLRDDRGEPIAFLYGHVREFDAENGQHVDSGTTIAKSGGDPDDPGAGFSDMANVHFEVIESGHPLLARAGTVNPHGFLENLYQYAAASPACMS